MTSLAYQDTHINIDGAPHILRHKCLNPIRHSVSLHTFLSRIDYLATSHDSPAFPPTKQNVSFCPEIAGQMLDILYSFAFEPQWVTHFFPRSAFRRIDQSSSDSGNSIPVVTHPQVHPAFSLSATQGEEGIEYSFNRRGKPCGHVFQKGEGVYHCSDCGIDPTCALCAKCFLASDHTGHDITYSIHSTGCGCCDCGDEEAWKSDIKCHYHSQSSPSASKDLPMDSNPTPSSSNLISLPTECRNVIEQIVTIALDFLLITLDRSPEDMTPPADLEAIYSELSRLEENTYLEMTRHPPVMPDDSMDVDLQYSHLNDAYQQPRIVGGLLDDAHKPSTSGLFSALWGNRSHDKGKGKITDPSARSPPSLPSSSLDAFALASDLRRFKATSHPKFPLNTSPAQGPSGGDDWLKWIQYPAIRNATDQKPRGAGPWGVVLWNDEKHSYAQVIDQVSKATGCSRADALRVANTVDTKGREVIQISSDPNVLLQTSKMISRIDLTVTVRTAHDLFCEQVADVVIGFLVDLASCRIYNCLPEEENWIKAIITEKLCEKSPIGYSSHHKTRFARLLLNDVKLWKEGRDRLKVLYISLLSLGQSVKLQLGILFASVFPQLIEYNLLIDREPEHNILLFSLQIVTVPSVIVVLVREHNFLGMIIDLLYSFFTHQFLPLGVSDTELKHIVYPPDYSKKTIDPEGTSFRHKRYYHLFHELNLVLSSPGVQEAICQDVGHLVHLITFLDLFTNMNPNKRAIHLHVEFESDAWVTAFNVTIQLAKLCKFFGECYSRASPREFLTAMHALVRKMMEREHEYHDVQFGSCEGAEGMLMGSGRTYKCIDFKTDKEPISFHHPLNWLLAELMRNVHRVDLKQMHATGVHTIGHLFTPDGLSSEEADLAALVVSEDVIRVSSLLAQVRAGLWVRNGFGVRAQQLHYREYSLRETTFDQDIFHLQVLLAAKDPSHVLVAIVDRFGLRQWCNGELLTDRVYEPSQMIAMLEELLHLLIILLSEPSGLLDLSHEASLQREIIHVLCLGPMPYSDIIKRIPDRYMQEFDQVLKKLTHFKQPVGTNDVGIYSLKSEHLQEVDPYYCRFGRNQREEAEKIVVDYLKSLTTESDPVLIPKRLNVTSGPFSCICETYTSEVFLQIIFYSLARVNPTMKGYSEYLADQAIHLVMMALVEQSEPFANMALEKKLPLKGANPHTMSLVMMLEAVDAEPAMKGVKKKVNWCLDCIANIVGLQRQAGGSKESTINAEQLAAQANEQKKEAAKARQNAIMNQFAAAQQAFLRQHDLGDDDDDEDDSEEDNDGMSTTRIAVDSEAEKVYGSCIVCQEDLTKARCFGALGLIQSSRLMRTTPLELPPEEADKWFDEVLCTPDSLDYDARKDGPTGVASKQPVNFSDTRFRADNTLEPVPWIPQGFPTRSSTKPGLFASACGHLMHLACFQTYYKSIELRHGTQVTRNHPESIERCEYLCPLCKSIGNVFLPSIDLSVAVIKAEDQVRLNLNEWLSSVKDIESHMQIEMGTSDYGFVLGLTDQDEIKPWLIHDTLRLNKTRPTHVSKPALSSEERIMLERFLLVTAALGHELGDQTDYVMQANLSRDLVGYTIACLEIANRGVAHAESGGIEHSLTDTQRRLINSLLLLLGWLIEAESGIKNAKLYSTALLMHQLNPRNFLSATGRAGANYGPFALVFVDPLLLLIQCAAVCPEAFSLVVPLCYHIELLRVLLKLCYYCSKYSHKWWQGGPEPRQTDATCLKEGSSLRKLVTKLVERGGISSTSNVLSIDDLKLERIVRVYMLPFLRRVIILKGVISDLKCPESDAQQGWGFSTTEVARDEHARLMIKLGIPTLADLFDEESKLNQSEGAISGVIRGLLHQVECSPTNHSVGLGGGPSNFFHLPGIAHQLDLEHPAVYELLGLPNKFDKLLSAAATRKCMTCNTVPSDPGICLFCGKTVCVQAFCCTNRNLNEEPEHGECNVHMWNCGGSVGMYLLIKKCSILNLSTKNGTFSLAPYLDEHGEHDLGMKRGRPQFLHQVRWEAIRRVWLTHSIPTHVARRLESSADVGGWPTF